MPRIIHHVEDFCHCKALAISMTVKGALLQLELLSYDSHYVNSMWKD